MRKAAPFARPILERKNAKARATFEAFPPSHRREYVEWITGAKQAETRSRRLATTIEWLSQGKQRNWKYAGC
ncbi:MAG: YdeI/OmpD-associated family protein [Planctomycetes bacterium]|nr:YdeI/OmpD-associated family protein [Planctomycetota bacterium]